MVGTESLGVLPAVRSGRARNTAGSITLAISALVGFSLLVPLPGWATDQVDVTGRVVFEHGDDFENRRAVDYVSLDTGRERYSLEGERARTLRDGQRVRIRAHRRGGAIVLNASSTVAAAPAGEDAASSSSGSVTTSSSGTTTTVATTTAAINKRVAVLLINFATPPPPATPPPSPSPSPSPSAVPGESPDPSASPSVAPPTASPAPTATPVPPPQPWTLNQVRGIYFSNAKSASSYFAEASNGRLSVTGEVYGWFTLAMSTDTCNYNGWANAARTAAAASGVNLSSFTNYVYAYPKVDACPWGGLGSVNGPHSWINGTAKMNLYVATHELGHNFGSHHAATLRCTKNGVRVAFSSNCTSNEYGDPFDIMGGMGSYSSTFHVNTWARRQIAALTTADQKTVTLNGVYSVATAQVAGGGPRILRVLRPAGDYYYLEYRQPYGLFDTWTTGAPVVNGVSIRIAPDTKRIPSQLIDTTPETTTFTDAPLAAGRTFGDPINGISIQTRSTSASGAVVRIQVGPDVVPPTAPSGLKAVISGPSSIKLTWTAASDDLEVAGYTVTRDGQPLATVTGLTFTDTNLAQAVSYSYSVTAFDSSNNLGPAAVVNRFLPDSLPPSPVADFSAVQIGPRQVSLAWGEASDNVGVTGFRLTRNGNVLATVPGLDFDDTRVIDGFSYTYLMSAVDAAGNAGSPLSATVSLPDVTPPTAPGGVTQAVTATAAARIDWSAATDNVAVAGYTVQRGGKTLATLGTSARSYSESGLVDGTYQYEVRAFDLAGNVGPVIALTASVSTRDVTAPTVPKDLTATSMNKRYIKLSWKPSTDDRPGTVRYALFRGTRRIALITTTTFTDRPAAVGTYKYKVRALDVAGNKSPFSPVITAKAKRRV
ncbi:hypothetical protein BH23CHL7_BH23CHL7_13480 [soil metagenome]